MCLVVDGAAMSASAPAEPPAPPSRARALRELAALFLWLGLTGFGGPAAHIALMEEATVRRRRWFSRQELLDMIAACQLIPGPTSTELAMHIGQRRAGLVGLLVAGASFIFPAAAVTLVLAWCYVRYGRLPAAEAVLAGVKPVMIAVVAEALFSLGGAALRSLALVLIAVLALAAAAAGLNEILVLIGSGLLVLLSRLRGRMPPAAAAALPALPAAPEAVLTGVATAVAAATPTALFTVFLKIGGLLFGSGYVLLAFLRAELVVRLGWLDERQLLDAVSIGQLTPGPLFTTATFIGYLLGGISGAGAATLGIFLPGFVLVALAGPLLPRLRRSPLAAGFLDGVNAAALALMTLVAFQLARAAVVDWFTAALALAAALALRLGLRSHWLIPAAALAGWIRYLL
jgi:chromate transporter